MQRNPIQSIGVLLDEQANIYFDAKNFQLLARRSKIWVTNPRCFIVWDEVHGEFATNWWVGNPQVWQFATGLSS